MVKNPPANAGDVGSIPGWGTKIPHAVEQLSLRATTTEHPQKIRKSSHYFDRSINPSHTHIQFYLINSKPRDFSSRLGARIADT